MCGIAGLHHFGRSGAVDPALLTGMSDRLVHRGPDDAGLYLSPNVGLAMRRLAVIDLISGAQPMSSADGRLHVVFNGEIYNFQSLREELMQRGRVFRTRSDTEVLLHLYDEMGDAFVSRLRGMFSFALWDEGRQRLVLGRDRMGKKPLFYSTVGGRLAWASELQALLTLPDLPRDVDPEAIDLYLALQYIPSPRTVFRSVRKLPPGHLLVCERGAVRVERYWDVPAEPISVGFEEAKRTIRARLTEATRLRMVSDVPVGAFLSGGIDSTCVVAMMAELSGRPIKTFAAGFDDEDFSELRHARAAARRFGTDHTEIVVRPAMSDVLPTLVRHYGEPFGDSSALPTFFVAREARRHVKVVLTGDGGDEDFAGYSRYRFLRLVGYGNERRTKAYAAVVAAGARWPARLDSVGGFYRLLGRLPAGAPDRLFDRYLGQMEIFDRPQRDALYTAAFRRALPADMPAAYLRALFDGAASCDMVNRFLQMDLRSYLPECLMTKLDIASMANSLETRSPFLDHEVVEYAARLSGTWKLRPPADHKWILKEAFRDVISPELLSRPKMGFSIPVDAWFRHGELKDMFQDLLFSRDATGRGWLDPAAVRALFDDHVSGRADHGNRLWSLLMLELWHRHVAPGAAIETDAPAVCA